MGAPLLVASSGDGVNWANVRGLAIASGNLYFALADGTLNRIALGERPPFGRRHHDRRSGDRRHELGLGRALRLRLLNEGRCRRLQVSSFHGSAQHP